MARGVEGGGVLFYVLESSRGGEDIREVTLVTTTAPDSPFHPSRQKIEHRLLARAPPPYICPTVDAIP